MAPHYNHAPGNNVIKPKNQECLWLKAMHARKKPLLAG